MKCPGNLRYFVTYLLLVLAAFCQLLLNDCCIVLYCIAESAGERILKIGE